MKKQIFVALTIVLASFTGILKAQIYSFEDEVVPTVFTTSNGSLSVSQTKFKLGIKSLCWDWKTSSKLTLDNPTGLEEASKKQGWWYLFMGV